MPDASHPIPLSVSDGHDTALYGKDPAEGLVALHLVRDTSGREAEPARMRLYWRRGFDHPDGGTIETEEVPFYPFMLIHDAELLRGFGRERFRYQRLDASVKVDEDRGGQAYFRDLVVFTSVRAYWDAVRHVERATESDKRRPDEIYFAGNPEQLYLMQTGRTLFKGMAFEHIHRLQLDIEVYAPDGFPQPERPEHAVIIVALSDNQGWSRLLHARDSSEKALLEETVRVIQERDPDVIEGHNIYGFDFDYLRKRCSLHGVPFAIGRDGSVPRQFPSSMRFAERMVDFPALDIAGRHVVDTLFQVMSFDVFKRDLPGYGLKVAAKYFGFADETRTYVEGSDIARVWDEDPARLLDYALDDVVETERLARHLSGSTFYLTQMVPMPYGQTARTGPASKIEALFVREYLRQRQALPRAAWGSQTIGGYTDVFVTGVVGPVVYADVESLYPSIMLQYDVRPKDDALGVFPDLLRKLTDLRFDTKAAMKATNDAGARAELDARQTAFKNIINSFYGNLAFSLALFNDFAEADRVAATGQDLLRQIIRLVRADGGTIIEVDTDGVLFIPPDGLRGDTEERAYVRTLSERMPEGIRIGFDGRFQKMLSYKKKNYALLGYDGRIKFKGSSLVSRSTECFGRRFVREAVRLLLNEDIQGLHDLYLAQRDRILAHDWNDGVADFQRTETLKNTVEAYEADVQAGRRTRTASYELAKQRAAQTGQLPRKGDRMSYYLAGPGPAFEAARLADAWDPAAPDEHTPYYLDRLDQVAAKFVPFFETEHQHRLVFSPEDLFGFDAAGIRLARTERALEDVEDDVPF
ncbi:MAG: DNA polymerase domain-containing protein [Bacteroidota bacterium]